MASSLGKIALVVGGSGALGSAITAQFASAGWRVLSADVRPPAAGAAPPAQLVPLDHWPRSPAAQAAVMIEALGGAAGACADVCV